MANLVDDFIAFLRSQGEGAYADLVSAHRHVFAELAAKAKPAAPTWSSFALTVGRALRSLWQTKPDLVDAIRERVNTAMLNAKDATTFDARAYELGTNLPEMIDLITEIDADSVNRAESFIQRFVAAYYALGGADWSVVYTLAPAVYDGFGTVQKETLRTDDGLEWRVVAVAPENMEWQLQRYASGGYAGSTENPQELFNDMARKKQEHAAFAAEQRAWLEWAKAATAREVKQNMEEARRLQMTDEAHKIVRTKEAYEEIDKRKEKTRKAIEALNANFGAPNTVVVTRSYYGNSAKIYLEHYHGRLKRVTSNYNGEYIKLVTGSGRVVPATGAYAAQSAIPDAIFAISDDISRIHILDVNGETLYVIGGRYDAKPQYVYTADGRKVRTGSAKALAAIEQWQSQSA